MAWDPSSSSIQPGRIGQFCGKTETKNQHERVGLRTTGLGLGHQILS